MYQLLHPKIITGKYYYVLELGRTGKLRMEILFRLQKQRRHLEQVNSVDQCDVILVLCPIASRAGTDIDAALNKLNNLSASKPAIFMVLHHTSDPYKVVPDSGRFIERMNMLTVDCLFHEDAGLLRCIMNDEALDRVVRCFKPQRFGAGLLNCNMDYEALDKIVCYFKPQKQWNNSTLIITIAVIVVFAVIAVFVYHTIRKE